MYWILSSYSHTITEWLTLEETTGGLLVQHSQPQLDVFWTSWKRETLQPLWVPKCSITFNIKMCYLVFRQNWLCSNDPLPFVVALGTTEKSLSLLYTFYTLIISVSCPLSSSPTSQTFPSRFWTVPALSSSSQERCSSHFIIFMVLFWTSMQYCIPELDSLLQMCPHQYWTEGKDHLPQAVTRTQCWFMLRDRKLWNW